MHGHRQASHRYAKAMPRPSGSMLAIVRLHVLLSAISYRALVCAGNEFRSPIANEAQRSPSRQPALARHSPHSTSHHSPCPAHPRLAFRKRTRPSQSSTRGKAICVAAPNMEGRES